jgi:hypothetical protein
VLLFPNNKMVSDTDVLMNLGNIRFGLLCQMRSRSQFLISDTHDAFICLLADSRKSDAMFDRCGKREFLFLVIN